ncbi:hypothetical protein NIES3806_32070 [Microcystis aeruginosa NIES-3806]|uniref:Uncharacterized protein n=1 Tax=Microcystis aeruginosa NIES-3787 TaxID=2517782 RepID=A0A6H9GB43_MICAE|nr:hypothetical protein [Microcystis aeruginosa]GCL47024.1 hypothetical protein NIES3787_27240 [Microcystis aeruginosa NIES-3787]GCL55852.1 hypothetical protein NIES3806_32070 [Microcystis aeruginosa NIES-3806]
MLEIVAGILLNRWLFGPMIAVMVILINAGPGLDREKLTSVRVKAIFLLIPQKNRVYSEREN